MEQQLIWILALIGAGTMLGVFWKMKGGFDPFYLRVVGILLIASFVSLIAIGKAGALNAAMGILGAIAGYLFGAREKVENEQTAPLDAGVTGSSDNAVSSDRDVNSAINALFARLNSLEEILSEQKNTLSGILAGASSSNQYDYLINTVYERPNLDIEKGVKNVIDHWINEGWEFVQLTSDYSGTGGLLLVFRRTMAGEDSLVAYYHGSQMEPRIT